MEPQLQKHHGHPLVGQTHWWVSSKWKKVEETSGGSVQNGMQIVFCTSKHFFFFLQCPLSQTQMKK